MNRIDIINRLIQKNGYKNYIEIGVQNGISFSAIKCAFKIGVDPDPNSKATIHDTSDGFFASNNRKWDIIFIDGLHEAEQVYKDIQNSLTCLSDGGTIVCHDMIPTSKEMQQVPRIAREWTGDCWKAWIKLRHENRYLDMCVVDTDYGVGIIQQGVQQQIDISECDYEYFAKHKKELSNIITEEEFLRIFVL